MVQQTLGSLGTWHATWKVTHGKIWKTMKLGLPIKRELKNKYSLINKFQKKKGNKSPTKKKMIKEIVNIIFLAKKKKKTLKKREKLLNLRNQIP